MAEVKSWSPRVCSSVRRRRSPRGGLSPYAASARRSSARPLYPSDFAVRTTVASLVPSCSASAAAESSVASGPRSSNNRATRRSAGASSSLRAAIRAANVSVALATERVIAVVYTTGGPTAVMNLAIRGVAMHSVLLVVAAFLACAVEMVEALTIVLAVAVTRGWRSAGRGVAAALAGLVLIIAELGPALAYLPIDSLRLVVGTILLVFGLQWLRKAVLRASGLKALHDEAAIYEENVAQLRAKGERSEHDWYGFTVAFKGVFLEGLEVAFIIVTFGGTQRNVGLAALAAGAALVVVLIAGILVHAPLTRVPENA